MSVAAPSDEGPLLRASRFLLARPGLAVFVLALLARAATTVVLDLFTPMLEHGFRTQAGWEFAEIAENLLAGNGYTEFRIQGQWVPSAYMPPAYTFFVAGVFALFGTWSTSSLVAIQVLQVVLGALTCVLVQRLGARWFTPAVGLLAGSILAAGYPSFLYMVAEPHPVTMYIALNLALVLLFDRRIPTPASGALAGFLGGVLALFRPETLALQPFLVLGLLWTRGWRVALKPAVLYTAVFVLAMAPWTIRNYAVFHRFLPVTSLAGFNLWRGQNEMTTGAGRGPGSEWYPPSIRAKIDALPPAPDYECRRDDIYRAEAIAFMKNHPGRSLALVPNKLFYYWVAEINDPRTHSPLYWGPWLLVAPFFLVGLVRSFFRPPRPWIAYVYLGVSTLLATVFCVLTRYRMFVEPFIVILAASAMVELGTRLHRRAPPAPE